MNKVSGHNKIKLVVGLVSLIAVLGIETSNDPFIIDTND